MENLSEAKEKDSSSTEEVPIIVLSQFGSTALNGESGWKQITVPDRTCAKVVDRSEEHYEMGSAI